MKQEISFLKKNENRLKNKVKTLETEYENVLRKPSRSNEVKSSLEINKMVESTKSMRDLSNDSIGSKGSRLSRDSKGSNRPKYWRPKSAGGTREGPKKTAAALIKSDRSQLNHAKSPQGKYRSKSNLSISKRLEQSPTERL